MIFKHFIFNEYPAASCMVFIKNNGAIYVDTPEEAANKAVELMHNGDIESKGSNA